MYKLTVVAGPNRGSSYAIKSGENMIGRHGENAIVLSSSKVSKRHCVVIVEEKEVTVVDQGSSNGTFVNGILTKNKSLKVGDRITVGEFVLELSEPTSRPVRVAPAVGGIAKGVQIGVPGGGFPMVQGPGISGVPAMPGVVVAGMSSEAPGVAGMNDGAIPGAGPVVQHIPKDPVGKVLWAFERYIMPYIYNFNFQNEWKWIGAGMFGLFMLANLLISVQPLMDAGEHSVVKESLRRAQLMSKLIADANQAPLAANAENRTDINPIIEGTTNDVGNRGVRLAALVRLDSRIIAPSTRANQYLTAGTEGLKLVRARKAYQNGEERGLQFVGDDGVVVAVEPVKVFKTSQGKNEVVALALVSIDTRLSIPSFGEMVLVYSHTLILTGVIGAIVLLIIYRLTLKPFEILEDDMDKVLKGEMNQVTHEYKFEELNSLWELINSALQRVPKTSTMGEVPTPTLAPSIEEFLNPMKLFGDFGKFGIALCDSERKVKYVNAVFEEVTGIRLDSAQDLVLSELGRDQSFGAMVRDLFDRAASDGVASDEYEFSEGNFKVHGASFGIPGNQSHAFLFALLKAEEA